jgi:hypothetical protein
MKIRYEKFIKSHDIYNVCACAKLFVEKKAHGTNHNIDGFYTKTTQKGGFSKLCVKIEKICYEILFFSQQKA